MEIVISGTKHILGKKRPKWVPKSFVRRSLKAGKQISFI